MRIKTIPDDFHVEEEIDLALVDRGPWAVYRVRKVGVTTLDVQTRLASQLGVGRAQVTFPALKDQDAIAVQYATLPGGLPEHLGGAGYSAQRVGYRLQPLSPADLRGNLFALVLRDMRASEARHVTERLAAISRYGLPNYFDDQRFGSLAVQGEPIGKAILRRDAARAVWAYLTQPFAGDPRAVLAFKQRAAQLWPELHPAPVWRALFEAAPKPSNYRSVLTYLIGHPADYRRALNLIPQRLLSIYLAAYQSLLWNGVTARYLNLTYTVRGVSQASLRIAGRSLPLHLALDDLTLAELATTRIALPENHARFTEPLDSIVREVLHEERLTLDDLKARILQKAYLTRGARSVLLIPQKVRVDPLVDDDRYPGRHALTAYFALPPGAYATLVLKAAHAPES